ncbi:MAG TPA: hypothetical protein VEP66_05530 [Myxococcales bacterium]|nr:hypothetical protein [Myxococcales bacterium]
MQILPAIDGAAPPRLFRAVCLQMLVLTGVALLSALPGIPSKKSAPVPEPEPKKREERRIRIVQLPKPPPLPKTEPAKVPPPPQAAPAQAQPAPAREAARPATASPAPTPAPALARIAADSTAMSGVRMRVLVPRSPAELAAHLRNSGACLVVSRLVGDGAEVLSVLGLDGSRAVQTSGPPCSGVPRLLRDPALNAALGDPLGRARAQSPGDEIVFQIILSPRLHDTAQAALRARFGAIGEEEMGRRAAESGYELTCFAEPAGPLRCE